METKPWYIPIKLFAAVDDTKCDLRVLSILKKEMRQTKYSKLCGLSLFKGQKRLPENLIIHEKRYKNYSAILPLEKAETSVEYSGRDYVIVDMGRWT